MPQIDAIVTGVREKRLSRNGDIGVDKPGCLESDGVELQRLRVNWEKRGFAQVMSDSLKLDEKKLKAEREKPSDYAGGSMEPMDRNLRMLGLIQKRIDELKTKWLAKP